jgi:hypothetical protein
MVGSSRRRRSRVNEVGTSLEAAHSSGSAVVGAGGFLSRVEGAEPAALLRLRVSDLGGIATPRPAAHTAVSHCATGFSYRPLVGGSGCGYGRRGGGGGALLVEVVSDGLRRVAQPV